VTYAYQHDQMTELMTGSCRSSWCGNRVPIEPTAFEARGELINTLDGFLTEAVPDDQHIVVGATSSSGPLGPRPAVPTTPRTGRK
jgi:hypothetical protein